MSSLGSLLMLLFEAIALFIRYRYDPEKLKREVAEAIDRENEKRRQAFRKSVAAGDEDDVSSRLADVADRLRDRKPGGEVPPGG